MADEYRELEEERILVLHHLAGRGKTSGVDLDSISQQGFGAALVHLRDGKVTRYVGYNDRAHAFADLRLEE